MYSRFVITAALAAVLAIPVDARAHEGHVHKVMGTVATRHENHLEVRATDGKNSTITLNEKTRILRGRTKATVEDIKPGERVVVTATETKGKDGRPSLIATEIRLRGAASVRDLSDGGIRADRLRSPSARADPGSQSAGGQPPACPRPPTG